MDDLLRDFVVETVESIDVVDNQLVRFEQEPNNRSIIDQIFRLVHTIKGTCGFLGLPRLETLTHAAETVLDKFRDGAPVTRDAVSLILSTIDRIKHIMAELERSQNEPAGEDSDLIGALDTLALNVSAQAITGDEPIRAPDEHDFTVGTLVYQVLERKLRPGEVSLDELERAFREANEASDDFSDDVLERAGLQSLPGTAEPAQEHIQASSGHDEAQDTAQSQNQNQSSSIRVPVSTLEHLMTMVSELVLTRNQLLEIARHDPNSAFKVPLQRLTHVTAELQESVMKTRMQPIGTAWAKLPRLVRDLSQELAKDIALVTSGAETEIDRQLLELIKDPMIHMIRNAADHGLETPGDRIKFGKPSQGTIKVTAAQEGGYITMTVSDDGRGLDLKRIREKVIRQGLASQSEVAQMGDAQIARYIFHPGLSTADKLTSISGRGVGMDVVKSNIEQMGGSVDVRTVSGQGTSFDIHIPLTLAIAAALIVEAGNQRFALPQTAVVELVKPNGGTDARIEKINMAPVLRLRERLLPLVQLTKILGLSDKADESFDSAFIVVCNVAGIRFGVVVDSVLQTEEIVVKPVSQQIRHISVFSGSTIMGDGNVIMILDPNGIVQTVGQLAGADNDNLSSMAADAALAENRTTLLVVKAGSEAPKAIPLALITRLEEIDVSKIEYTGGHPIVQYRGKLMRLAACEEGMQVRSSGNQPVVVFSYGHSTIGLMVDEIIDIIDETLEITANGAKAGVLGSAILRGKATDIIDVTHFVPELGGKAAHQKQMQSVLLVEPSDFLRAMLAPVLQAAGYSVVQASNLDEAKRYLTGMACPLVVANLEDRSVFSLTTQAAPTTCFIGLSDHASPDLLNDASAAGFDDVVGVFDREGLLACLKQFSDTQEKAA